MQDPVLSHGVAPFWMLLWALLTVLWIAAVVLWKLLILVNPFTWTHLWLLLSTIAGARASLPQKRFAFHRLLPSARSLRRRRLHLHSASELIAVQIFPRPAPPHITTRTAMQTFSPTQLTSGHVVAAAVRQWHPSAASRSRSWPP
jgi:hypothetical protein